MGHNHHHHNERVSPYDDPFLACFCCPCYLVSSMFRGIGRCMFTACYPVMHCFGWDRDQGPQHHHHHRHSY
ncbi:hypothetical protein RHMOL_Rhmol03G0177100 [Rhododendron molle]|uniref:Uncharacterized protein n=2 Tax=Rhododendron TaxID=4346 RepID=A0ACC0PGU7_RHOML|nr:hypothetical protein RHMOL_Rhmol03G0177100 [Rhododendron molle]